MRVHVRCSAEGLAGRVCQGFWVCLWAALGEDWLVRAWAEEGRPASVRVGTPEPAGCPERARDSERTNSPLPFAPSPVPLHSSLHLPLLFFPSFFWSKIFFNHHTSRFAPAATQSSQAFRLHLTTESAFVVLGPSSWGSSVLLAFGAQFAGTVLGTLGLHGGVSQFF